jgi:D-alanyl-D-alanine carboxypeptidase/D-alanyl-D-alanine-endopeptidase (penicillin-binding protein 4)
MRSSLFITALLISCGSVRAQDPAGFEATAASAINRVIDAQAFSNGFWGIHVVDLESGRTVYARNAAKSFVPASNIKLYTTAAALDLLGPSYRYETRVYVDGPVEDGVLHGNVIVRGAADPTIGGHYEADTGEWNEDVDALRTFRDWADSLRSAGIRRIEGDLIGDDDVIDDEPLGSNWSWDDETYYYSAQLAGLAFHDNVVHMYVAARAPDMPAEIRWEPFDTDYIDVINRTWTDDRAGSIDEGYRRFRGTNRVEVTTIVPMGGRDVEEITVENPTRYFVHVLRESLLRSGIAVSGNAVDVDELSIKPDYQDPRYRRVAVHRSDPLSRIAALINKPSQNLYADLLLKTLGAELPGEDEEFEPGSAEAGAAAATTTFVRAGIDTSRVRLADGSGLSRLNLVTPEMTTSLLRYMWDHEDRRTREAFYNSLPTAGLHGTLRHRFGGGPARGVMRGKTGSLSFASSLSGYLRTGDGRSLAFSIMSNHYTSRTSRVRAAQDAIVNLLSR